MKVLLESPTESVSASLLQQRTTWQGLGPNCRFGQVPRTLEAGVGFAENRKGLEVKGRELRVVGWGFQSQSIFAVLSCLEFANCLLLLIVTILPRKFGQGMHFSDLRFLGGAGMGLEIAKRSARDIDMGFEGFGFRH